MFLWRFDKRGTDRLSSLRVCFFFTGPSQKSALPFFIEISRSEKEKGIFHLSFSFVMAFLELKQVRKIICPVILPDYIDVGVF